MPVHLDPHKPVDPYLPKILLVEGKDDAIFLDAFLTHFNLSDILIINLGGAKKFKSALKALRNTSGFSNVVSLGIIRDADENFSSSFQSISDSLDSLGLPAPAKAGQVLSHSDFRTGIFIFPDCENRGMLETLCLESVQDDPAMECVHYYFDCLKAKDIDPKQREKAIMQVFFASREDVPPNITVASNQGVWPWDSTCFTKLRKFILSL